MCVRCVCILYINCYDNHDNVLSLYYYIGALDCPASYCHEIVLLVGNILVNLTSEIESTWQVVIESGLANVLIGSLSSFSIHPGVSDSEVIHLHCLYSQHCSLMYLCHSMPYEFLSP